MTDLFRDGKKVVIRANAFVQHDLVVTIIKVDAENKQILLSLDKPLINGSERYQHAVASVRLVMDDLDTLVGVGILGCAVTWVPDGKFSQKNPFNLNWWRGGAAAITDLRTV